MTIPIPRDLRGVRNAFQGAPIKIQKYFESIQSLIDNYTWEVSVAYAFLKLEQAHNYTLYAGVRKRHRADAKVAARMIDSHHITRKGFQELFKNVFDEHIPDTAMNLLKDAEKVRDKIIHGKTAHAEEQRKALMLILHYAIELENLVQRCGRFSPFVNDRRGLTGRGESLDASTTRWLMKGLGFERKERRAGTEDDAVE